MQGLAIGKNILVAYSNTNSHGKYDASGAFIPEAKAFAKLHEIPDENVIGIKLPKVAKRKRRDQTLAAIAEAGKDRLLDAIALFGHGWPRGIQFGFNREHIPQLVEHLIQYCQPDVKITLFACLAAENDVRDRSVTNLGPATDGGFADLLRDEMVRRGLDRGWVDGHKTAGHTSWNPFLVRFLCADVDDPEIGAQGGAWLVAPRSETWKKWIAKLRDQKSGMRYRFPFLREIEVKAELLGARELKMDELTIRV